MVKPISRGVLAGVTLALVAGLTVAATPADAATPPYEPDPQAVGTIAFYDSSGNPVTSGSITAKPFAAYAVGSTTVRAGDVKAAFFAAQPNPTSVTGLWNSDQLSGFTSYPLSTGPANIQTLSQTHPVATGAVGDLSVSDFIGEFPNTDPSGAGCAYSAGNPSGCTNTAYQNLYQIRLETANPMGSFQNDKYDVADLLVNPTAGTFQVVYPTAATAPGAPGTPTAVAHNASATVSWSAPTSDGGSAITGYKVEYSSDGGTTWSAPISVSGTSTTVPGLTNGTAYVFWVEAVNTAGTGPWSALSAPVTPVADTTSLVIAGPSSANYGATGSFTATLKDATTGHVLSGTVSLYRRASSTAAWTLVKSLTTSATTGTAAVAYKLVANGQFEFRYTGTSLYKAVTSAIKAVSVKQLVTLKATATSVTHGHAVKLYGWVAPAGVGQAVVLQQLIGTTWKTVATQALAKRLLPNGVTTVGFLFARTLSTIGTYKFRVTKAATATLAAGTSVIVTVKAS